MLSLGVLNFSSHYSTKHYTVIAHVIRTQVNTNGYAVFTTTSLTSCVTSLCPFLLDTHMHVVSKCAVFLFWHVTYNRLQFLKPLLFPLHCDVVWCIWGEPIAHEKKGSLKSDLLFWSVGLVLYFSFSAELFLIILFGTAKVVNTINIITKKTM